MTKSRSCHGSDAITEARTLTKRGFAARLIPLSVASLGPHSQVMFASLATITAQEDALRAFLRATFEGWRAVLERPEEAADVVAAHSAEQVDTLLSQLADCWEAA